MSEPLALAKTGSEVLCLLPGLANRHGLVAGATGTGKTVTLQVLAERCSRIGVPVFMADVKGDFSGISAAAASPEDERSARDTGARRADVGRLSGRAVGDPPGGRRRPSCSSSWPDALHLRGEGAREAAFLHAVIHARAQRLHRSAVPMKT
jgi:Helicase HerA-like C-terminal